jgi:hypothetical protein
VHGNARGEGFIEDFGASVVQDAGALLDKADGNTEFFSSAREGGHFSMLARCE